MDPNKNNGAQPQNQPQNQSNNASQPTFNTLGVHVSSPTHFDNQNTVSPVVNYQNNNMSQPQNPVATKTPEDPAKTIKKFTILSIVLGVLSVVFLILGIIGLMSMLSTSDQLNAANKTIQDQKAIISAVEESTGQTITSPADVPTYKVQTGYIYVTEWNIKMKIPEDLTDISYILDEKYRPQMCFNGYKKGVQYFPAFADIDQNPGGMGCLTRVQTSEGNIDAATGLSFGTPVFTHGDYTYFYNEPYQKSANNIYFSTNEAERGLEQTGIQLIKNMLTDNISSFE